MRKHICHHIRHIRQSRRTGGRGRERPRTEESRERAKDNGNSKENQPKREGDQKRKASEERRQVRNKARIPGDSEANKLDHRNLHQNKHEETTLNRFSVQGCFFCFLSARLKAFLRGVRESLGCRAIISPSTAMKSIWGRSGAL